MNTEPTPETPPPPPMTIERWKAIRAAREKDAVLRRKRPQVAAGIDLIRALMWMKKLPCFRNVGTMKLVVSHAATRGTRGTARVGRRVIRLRIGPDATQAGVLELLLHEMTHLALPCGTMHSLKFRLTLREAAQQAWGIDARLDAPAIMGVIAYGMDEVIRKRLDELIQEGVVDTFSPEALPETPARAERLAGLVERRQAHVLKMLARAEKHTKAAQRTLTRWRAKAAYYERQAAKKSTS